MTVLNVQFFGTAIDALSYDRPTAAVALSGTRILGSFDSDDGTTLQLYRTYGDGTISAVGPAHVSSDHLGTLAAATDTLAVRKANTSYPFSVEIIRISSGSIAVTGTELTPDSGMYNFDAILPLRDGYFVAWTHYLFGWRFFVGEVTETDITWGTGHYLGYDYDDVQVTSIGDGRIAVLGKKEIGFRFHDFLLLTCTSGTTITESDPMVFESYHLLDGSETITFAPDLGVCVLPVGTEKAFLVYNAFTFDEDDLYPETFDLGLYADLIDLTTLTRLARHELTGPPTVSFPNYGYYRMPNRDRLSPIGRLGTAIPVAVHLADATDKFNLLLLMLRLTSAETDFTSAVTTWEVDVGSDHTPAHVVEPPSWLNFIDVGDGFLQGFGHWSTGSGDHSNPRWASFTFSTTAFVSGLDAEVSDSRVYFPPSS